MPTPPTPPLNLANPDEFLALPSYNSGGYHINLAGSALDLDLLHRSTDLLVILFNGAVDRTKVPQPPCYTGRRISAELSASCLFVSDPIFYCDPQITLGWYGGHATAPLQKILPNLLTSLIEKNGYRRVLLVGGSGGGFASLYYGRLLPHALSLVWNPQTILENYYPTHVATYARVAFGTDKARLHEFLCSSLPKHYAETLGNNRVIYLQNHSDNHVARHLTHFLAARGLELPEGLHSGWLDSSLYLHLTDWSEGHTPPPRPVLLSLLQSLADPAHDWSQFAIANTVKVAAANIVTSTAP